VHTSSVYCVGAVCIGHDLRACSLFLMCDLRYAAGDRAFVRFIRETVTPPVPRPVHRVRGGLAVADNRSPNPPRRRGAARVWVSAPHGVLGSRN